MWTHGKLKKLKEAKAISLVNTKKGEDNNVFLFFFCFTPALFNLCIDTILSGLDLPGFNISEYNHNSIRYLNDTVFIAEWKPKESFSQGNQQKQEGRTNQ